MSTYPVVIFLSFNEGNARLQSISFQKKIVLFWSTDSPAQPNLITSNLSPTDGDSVTLNCATSTNGITRYSFLKAGVSVSTTASNTYVMNTAAIDSDDGSYTCIVFIGTVASPASTALDVFCEFCWESNSGSILYIYVVNGSAFFSNFKTQRVHSFSF